MESNFDVLREDADFEEVYLDEAMMRAHQHAAGASKKGGATSRTFSRGINYKDSRLCRGTWSTRQLHSYRYTGQRCDAVKNLIEETMPGSVSADRAYDSDGQLTYIADKGAQAVIPPRANSVNLTATTIATAISLKLASRFKSIVEIVASIIWLK